MQIVIVTQIAMHISVILATIPCIRPWLHALESGGLQSPAVLRHPKLAPLLPIAMPPAASDEDVTAAAPGTLGHRRRVEAWPVEFFAGDVEANRTVTTVRYDAAEAREMARKKSINSSESSRGITRTTSFSVKFDEVESHLKQQQQQQRVPRPGRLSRATSFNASVALHDAGGILEEVRRARLKSRVGSVSSI